MLLPEPPLAALLDQLKQLAPVDRDAILARLAPHERQAIETRLRGPVRAVAAPSPFSPDINERLAQAKREDGSAPMTERSRAALARALPAASPAAKGDAPQGSLLDLLAGRVRRGWGRT